jgi:tripartite-type tricarboxylate transporter receptor subunit TctC
MRRKPTIGPIFLQDCLPESAFSTTRRRRKKMKGTNCLRWLQVLVIVVLFFSLSPTADAADPYPTRPITMIVGYAPGGSTDLIMRALSETAGKILNQPVAVVYKPGGASSVSLSLLKGEKPDGYTIGLMAVGGVRATLLQKLTYDPIGDFTHIMQFGEYQFGMGVAAGSPWKTIDQFVQHAKANPGKIRYAHPGVGSGGYLAMERLAMETGIKWSSLPYEGDSQVITALMGGHVDAGTGAAGGWKDYVDGGKVRMLALFTEKRAGNFPDVPTLAEGYRIVMPGPMGIVGPKGLPDSISTKLHDTFKKCMENPTFITTAQKFGISDVYRSSQDFKKYLRTMIDEDVEMIQKLGLRK